MTDFVGAAESSWTILKLIFEVLNDFGHLVTVSPVFIVFQAVLDLWGKSLALK